MGHLLSLKGDVLKIGGCIWFLYNLLQCTLEATVITLLAGSSLSIGIVLKALGILQRDPLDDSCVLSCKIDKII